MPADRKPTRYAHADGHTDVCYSEDGQKLVTCGTDGDIRVWSGFEDVDPVQTCVGEWALCVRQKGRHLFVATDNNDVQKMTFPDAERDGLLVRFACHVTHMAVTKAHDVIAVVSEDMSVKVISLGDASSVFAFSELKGPPLSVALCPKAKFLAVSCGDGWLRIWNLESQTQVKGLECAPKANTFTNADLLCRMDFEPNSGHTLAYPDKNTVVILDVADWSTKFVLTCPNVGSHYSICQYSPCGKYMAAAAQNGDLVIWEIVTQTATRTKHSSEASLSSMVWNPSGNGEIAYCDVYGQLGIVTGCTEVVATATRDFVVDEAAEKGQVDFSGYEFVNDDDDDEDNENAISLEKLKQDIMGPLEPELDFDKESRRSRSPTPRPRTPEIPMQPPFIPSSTPEHLNPRYMCWNEVGVIRSYGTDSDEDNARSIEVEFHDATVHGSMMMQNYHGYTMGSLSAEVLLVANTNQITAIPLRSGSKEWILRAGDDEEIVCVACSEKLVCFAMANYLVRVCSVYGTQKGVLLVPGPVISMSASGYRLLIAYHSAAPRKGDQCVGAMLVKFEGLTIESKSMNVALQPETTVSWLGFTDTGTPAVQDSFGMLYLHPMPANLWIPFCDTSKHSKNPTDGFFVTAIYESLQSVWGIRCRGSNYPGFTPRPTVGELPLEPPFAEADTEKSQLEAGLFAWSTLKVESVERKFKEAALKTFALACKNDLDQRALELIELIANPQLVTLATKYAAKQRKQRLSEKLMELALKFQESENEESGTGKKHDESAVIGSSMPRFVLGKQKSKASKGKVQSVSDTNSDAETSLINKSTLEEASYLTDTSLGNLTDTQESLFSNPEPRNPFLKSNKQVKPGTSNPLSLTDKYAGYTVEEPKKEKENRNSLNNGSGSEKRKQSDFESDRQKQSKLAKFMFSKKE